MAIGRTETGGKRQAAKTGAGGFEETSEGEVKVRNWGIM